MPMPGNFFILFYCFSTHIRWKEEAAADVLRFQEKFILLEQEKTDAVLVVKKKMDALEVTKTNELGRLKDVH